MAVAEASGARLEGMMAIKTAGAARARAVSVEEKTPPAAPTDAPSAEARPKHPAATPKRASRASAAAADLDALFFTAEGWVAGDLASAVRGALEARRKRRREGEKGEGGGSSSVGGDNSGGESGAELEKKASSSSSSSSSSSISPPLSPPPPLFGPLTAREIVDALLSGPRPPKASELAAALDWARAAAAAAAAAGEEDEDGGGRTAAKTSKPKERASSSSATAKR